MASIELPAVTESLHELATFVRAECESNGVEDDDRRSIELICDELAANLCMHAYAGGQGSFAFGIEFEGETCALRFVDAGPPFDPTLLEPPDTEASIEERGIGGLGIHFVRQQSESFEYERRDDLNVVTVIKRVRRRAP